MIQPCRLTDKPSDPCRPLTPMVCLHNSTLLFGRRGSQGLELSMKAVHSTAKPLGSRCRPKHTWRKGRCVECGLWRLGTPQRVEFNFWRKVKKTKTCWLWQGCQNNKKRGSFLYQGHVIGAHKVSWLLLRGPVPDDLELDHLCRVPLCVKPDHLEPVEHKENLRRSPFHQYCRRGHLLEGNRFVSGNSSRCGICYRSRLAEARLRRKAMV